MLLDPAAGTPPPQDINKQITYYPLHSSYGNPLQVDGAWYTLALSAEQDTITVAPFTGPTGTLQFDFPCWEAELSGQTYHLHLVGNTATTTVPVDSYKFDEFQGFPDTASAANVISVGENTAKALRVDADSKVHVGAGADITARINVTQQHRDLNFTYELKDALGNDILRLTGTDPSSNGADNVPFDVFNAAGKSVYHGSFEPG